MNVRDRRVRDEDLTFGARCAAAFASLLLSLPAVGALWFLFNSQLAWETEFVIPGSWLVGVVVGIAVFAFLFPRFAADAVGRIWALLMAMGRAW